MDSKWLALLILLVISAVHGASTEPAATGKVEICLKGPEPGDCTEPQGIATDTETGLDPSTTYHCRVVAEYPGGTPKRGLEGEFKTAKH